MTTTSTVSSVALTSTTALLSPWGAPPKALHDMENELLLELRDYLSMNLAPENYWKTVDALVQLKSGDQAYAELRDGSINVRVEWFIVEDENDAEELLSALSDYLAAQGVPDEHIGFEYVPLPVPEYVGKSFSFVIDDVDVGNFNKIYRRSSGGKSKAADSLPGYHQLSKPRGSKGKPKRW